MTISKKQITTQLCIKLRIKWATMNEGPGPIFQSSPILHCETGLHLDMRILTSEFLIITNWLGRVEFSLSYKGLPKITYSTIQYNTIQYNTIQCNAMQYNAIQYNTI